MEIEHGDHLGKVLARGGSLSGLRLQALDLDGHESQLLARRDLHGLVVLGGRMSEQLEGHLLAHGAMVFPTDPSSPVDIYRTDLYTAHELYAGLDSPAGYPATPDAKAYAWSQDRRLRHDAFATLQRAIHDDQICDELDEFIGRRRVVGIMGGHAAQRDSDEYADAARIALRLASRGLMVATGGGPGLMEAANLGARCANDATLSVALQRLSQVPDFHDDVTAWARTAFEVLRTLPETTRRTSSLGIPTWFYGHEPPNVFGNAIAKYFSNALREDGLLARCTAGIIVLPGAAGTVQEVFQASTRLYYASPAHSLAPMVLVGQEHWTATLPVWPALQALGHGRSMEAAVHLVDTIDDAAALVIG